MYNDPSNSGIVDFLGVAQEGFAFVADTTGHRYETEAQLQKKRELNELWGEFRLKMAEDSFFKALRRHKKIKFQDLQSTIYHTLNQVGTKMLEIGKTSTFCALLTVWASVGQAKEPQPAVIVIQIGDSSCFRYSYRKQRGYTVEPLTNEKKKVLNSTIAGDMRGMEITIHPLRTGDVFILMTDGLVDHLGATRRPSMEEQIATLQLTSEMVFQVVHDSIRRKYLITNPSPENQRAKSPNKIARTKSPQPAQTLTELYQGIFEFSKVNAEEKLKQEIIREAELDDVGCVIAVAPFFESKCELLKALGLKAAVPIQYKKPNWAELMIKERMRNGTGQSSSEEPSW
eukprot:CAMPEP_0201485660 /NCGR_PEP_ID=MMETSP0151_2-20130828/9753_1 /ASSEMBLY_ACC=CAM_ASM_000257 /TAXON_ID=200890 /ORGANISM="Paramoeba atlantica, Strain 621/1 / CCAP 1560/9" /LENGTH=342 /DNA_ID=CAMNT_0047869893 /DNA_START=742 /DNA_END=1770 /DNA_ORIENTATION=-